MIKVTAQEHYDLLADGGDGPVHDPAPLKEYMNKWDGEAFIRALCLDGTKSVLEIGPGTGRLAVRIAPLCGFYTGIDISPKTISRLEGNLSEYSHKSLICADFLTYEFDKEFDVICSSLTFFHIKDKRRAVQKAKALLKAGGRLVLSISKDKSGELIYNERRVELFPDDMHQTEENLLHAGFKISGITETELAYIFAALA